MSRTQRVLRLTGHCLWQCSDKSSARVGAGKETTIPTHPSIHSYLEEVEPLRAFVVGSWQEEQRSGSVFISKFNLENRSHSECYIQGNEFPGVSRLQEGTKEALTATRAERLGRLSPVRPKGQSGQGSVTWWKVEPQQPVKWSWSYGGDKKGRSSLESCLSLSHPSPGPPFG